MMNALEFFKTLAWLVGAVLTSAVCGVFFCFAAIEIYARLHPEEKIFSRELGAMGLFLYSAPICFPIGSIVGFSLFWKITKMINNHVQK